MQRCRLCPVCGRARPDDIPGGRRGRRCAAPGVGEGVRRRRGDAGGPDEKCDFNGVYSIE